tara:strand:+ start:126 stop:929 length:804 start_codon:yes stop_codon:yes gene_type:complete
VIDISMEVKCREIGGGISVSNPLVQEFPSLIIQLQETLNAENKNMNSLRVGVLVLRHSDRPLEHDNDTHITEKGEIRIDKSRDIMNSLGIEIDSNFVFSSPVIRCVQTAARISSISEPKVQKVGWITGSPWNQPGGFEDTKNRTIWEGMKSDLGWDKACIDWLSGDDTAEGLYDSRDNGKINFDSIYTNILYPLAEKLAKSKILSFTNDKFSRTKKNRHIIAVCCTHDICIMGLATYFQSKTNIIPFLGGLFVCFDFIPLKNEDNNG